MIALVAFAVLGLYALVAIREWRLRLDGFLVLDALRPTAREVARAERELPELRDRYWPLNEDDVEYLEAVADFLAEMEESA